MAVDPEVAAAIESLTELGRGINDHLRTLTELTMDIDNRLIGLIGVLAESDSIDDELREELAAIAQGYSEKRAELARLRKLDKLRRGR